MAGQQLGKEALLDAAALLFDAEGVDAMSLNRINRASGHRNRSAANYHFGGKDAVVVALVQRGMSPIDARRVELLDELLAREPEPSLRQVLHVAALPLSEVLDSEAGRRHARFVGQLVSHPRWLGATQDLSRLSTGLARCAALALGHLSHLAPAVRQERVGQVVAFATRAYADQARLLDADLPARPPLPVGAFTDNVVDLMEAMLTAPSSVAPTGASPDALPDR